MSDPDAMPQTSIAPPPRGGGFRIWGRVVLFLCLAGVVGYVAADAIRTMGVKNALLQNEQSAVVSSGLITPAPKHLASRFTDAHDRLLADPPTAPDQLINPDTLTIAHLDNSDEIPGPSWADFDQHLQEETGKSVADVPYDGTPEQFARITAGKITLVAVHAADAPFLVNNYGFEPVAVLGNEQGANGNHLDIIVPANSSITAPIGLKGHSLACSAPSSITGYRAAIATLAQNDNLRPNVDYFIVWSMSQKRSIMGVVGKQFDAAAVSDDKLQTLLGDGKVEKSQFKVIHQSDVIPRTTIGCFYNLNPDLAAKVQKAILDYSPSAGPDVLRFLAVNYRTDFQFVRTIDASFDPRLDKAAKSKKD